MSKIVYLFGAGASANALPVVNQVPDRIRKMIEDLPELEAKDKSLHPCESENLQVLLDELKWLHEIIGDHATMDTLAKKLWIQKNFDEYNRLRFAISTYFVLEQAYQKPDSRYETFFTALYDDTRSHDDSPLSNQVSILSWNYDSQFEIAYHGIGLQFASFMDDIHAVLGIDTNRIGTKDKFNILKLNGTALLSMDKSPVNPFWGRRSMSIANYIHTLYIEGRDSENIYNPLSFAWDDFNSSRDLSKNIESRVNGAEILIIVGYSFPFFNRAIDRKIIESMPNLKKIYFQDKDPDNIAKAFKAISNKSFEIETTSYTDQFFLPPEL